MILLSSFTKRKIDFDAQRQKREKSKRDEKQFYDEEFKRDPTRSISRSLRSGKSSERSFNPDDAESKQLKELYSKARQFVRANKLVRRENSEERLALCRTKGYKHHGLTLFESLTPRSSSSQQADEIKIIDDNKLPPLDRKNLDISFSLNDWSVKSYTPKKTLIKNKLMPLVPSHPPKLLSPQKYGLSFSPYTMSTRTGPTV